MAETDLPLRRKAPLRRRLAAATVFAVSCHLAILGIFLYSTPDISFYTKEPRSISVDLVESLPALKPAAPERRPLQPKPAPPTSGQPQAPQAHEAPRLEAPAASPTPVPSTFAGTLDSAALSKALRGSVIGCAHADTANLTDAERQHCQDRFAANRADGPDLTQLAISPEKRAIFDAAWKADHSPQHMAGVICLARFGGGKLEWLHPSEGVKLGPLPCYVFTPKATFSADPPHARGWQ